MHLDDQIAANKRKSAWLFVALFLIMLGAVSATGFLLGVPILPSLVLGAVGAGIYLAIAGSQGVKAVLAATKAREPNMRDPLERSYVHIVEEISIAAQMPMPKVYVQPSADLNAFATGKDPEHGIVCVTEGALRAFNREELQGVVAHEMAHIQNYDIKVATTAIATIGFISILGEMLWWRFIFGGGGRRDNRMDPRIQLALFAVALLFIIFAPLLSRLTYLAISRQREYLADATGAKFTRNPEGLANALEKIANIAPKHATREDRTVAALYISNPFKRTSKESLFSTHPPILSRIARLRGQE